MTDSGALALAALLLPGLSFVLLSIVYPLRRAGGPAAWLSVLFSAGALAAAVSAWWRSTPQGFVLRLWEWIPSEAGPLATVGVLADADSTLMLVLVAGVSF